MNRFAALGLGLEALLREKRIIVLVSARESISDVLGCFESVPELAEQPGFRVRYRNGEACVDFGGRGRIAVQSVRSSLRSMSADIAVIEDDAALRLMPSQSSALYDDIERVIAGSAHAEIVPARRSRHVDAR